MRYRAGRPGEHRCNDRRVADRRVGCRTGGHRPRAGAQAASLRGSARHRHASLMRVITLRGVVAAIAVGALTLVGTATPAEASPWEKARRTAAATIAEVRSAAAVNEARVAAQTEAPTP